MSNVIEKFRKVMSLVKAVAPESVSNLNDGATHDELATLREVVPFAPAVLFDLLALHNGEEMIAWTSMFPDGMQLMTVEHIVQSSKYFQSTTPRFIDNLDELVSKRVMQRPLGPVKAVFSYAKRVPFAHVNAELLWYFDMDPAVGGRIGQIVYEDAEGLTLGVVAQSFDDLLDRYVRDIESGAFFADPENGQISSSSTNWYAHPGVAIDG